MGAVAVPEYKIGVKLARRRTDSSPPKMVEIIGTNDREVIVKDLKSDLDDSTKGVFSISFPGLTTWELIG